MLENPIVDCHVFLRPTIYANSKILKLTVGRDIEKQSNKQYLTNLQLGQVSDSVSSFSISVLGCQVKVTETADIYISLLVGI